MGPKEDPRYLTVDALNKLLQKIDQVDKTLKTVEKAVQKPRLVLLKGGKA